MKILGSHHNHGLDEGNGNGNGNDIGNDNENLHRGTASTEHLVILSLLSLYVHEKKRSWLFGIYLKHKTKYKLH